MKIGIGQEALKEAISKGAIAALSEDAQEDTSTMRRVVQSVKITADKQITIESSTTMLAVKYTIPASEDKGVVVKEAGSILVPAKELLQWISLQSKDSSISITLQKLETPEIINMLDGETGETEDAPGFVLKKIGTVKLVSKTTSKSNKKWELDCYDPEDLSGIVFNQKSEKCFDIQGSQLPEAITNVSFAAQKKDYEHVLDSISIQNHKDAIYFVTTDQLRVALYMVPKDTISDIQSTKSLLIPSVLLDQAAKIINKEKKVTFSYSEELEKVSICQDNLKIRVVSTEKEHIKKFPSIKFLVDKEYCELAEIGKKVMNDLLVNAALVNGSFATLAFSKADGTLTITATSADNKYKPSVGQAPVASVSKDAELSQGVTHIIEGLKILKSDIIRIGVASNQRSIKIIGKDNDHFSYFCQAVSDEKVRKLKEVAQ